MDNAAPNAIQWIILLALSIYGLWLLIRGWQQFKNPSGSPPLGLGWLIRLSTRRLTEAKRVEVDEVVSHPAIVRLWAGCAIALGVLAISLLVWVWIVSRP